jgi:hypothetical protein
MTIRAPIGELHGMSLCVAGLVCSEFLFGPLNEGEGATRTIWNDDDESDTRTHPGELDRQGEGTYTGHTRTYVLQGDAVVGVQEVGGR